MDKSLIEEVVGELIGEGEIIQALEIEIINETLDITKVFKTYLEKTKD